MKIEDLIPFPLAKKKPRRSIPGDEPGTIQPSESSLKPRIFLYAYNKEHLEEHETADIREALQWARARAKMSTWIDIRGLGDVPMLEYLRDELDLNPLVLEDIVNTYQRPKIEDYDHYLFAVSRMLELERGLRIRNEQISFLLFEDMLISFQEDYEDILDPVRKRLRAEKNMSIRNLGPAYLLYALMDNCLDYYFTILDRFSDELDMIEQHLYKKPQKILMYRIQEVKRGMIGLRRSIWPERDKINEMLRLPTDLVGSKVKVYLRDTYDHTIQLIDLVETYKEIASNLMDMYLSLMSNRMNEIMKFLTIVSAIFIPLTFIAGVYGMNFAYQDPETGKVLPNNMPELYAENGYLYTMIIMGLIALGEVIYFWRKGWFK